MLFERLNTTGKSALASLGVDCLPKECIPRGYTPVALVRRSVGTGLPLRYTLRIESAEVPHPRRGGRIRTFVYNCSPRRHSQR